MTNSLLPSLWYHVAPFTFPSRHEPSTRSPDSAIQSIVPGIIWRFLNFISPTPWAFPFLLSPRYDAKSNDTLWTEGDASAIFFSSNSFCFLSIFKLGWVGIVNSVVGMESFWGSSRIKVSVSTNVSLTNGTVVSVTSAKVVFLSILCHGRHKKRTTAIAIIATTIINPNINWDFWSGLRSLFSMEVFLSFRTRFSFGAFSFLAFLFFFFSSTNSKGSPHSIQTNSSPSATSWTSLLSQWSHTGFVQMPFRISIITTF